MDANKTPQNSDKARKMTLLSGLFARADMHRRGIGRKIMAALETEARKNDADLYAYPDKHPYTRKFCEAEGWSALSNRGTLVSPTSEDAAILNISYPIPGGRKVDRLKVFKNLDNNFDESYNDEVSDIAIVRLYPTKPGHQETFDEVAGLIDILAKGNVSKIGKHNKHYSHEDIVALLDSTSPERLKEVFKYSTVTVLAERDGQVVGAGMLSSYISEASYANLLHE